jgi:hypothetical protein
MMGDMEIRYMSAHQLSEEISQKFRWFEKYIPESYRLQFGEWNQFQTLIEQLQWEWNQVCEDRYREIEERKTAEDKYNALVNQVREIQSYVENIEIDRGVDYVEGSLQSLFVLIDKAIDPDVPVEKKKNSRKK